MSLFLSLVLSSIPFAPSPPPPSPPSPPWVQIGGPAKAAGKSEEVIYPIRQDWEGRSADRFSHLLTFNPSSHVYKTMCIRKDWEGRSAAASDRFSHLLNPSSQGYSIPFCPFKGCIYVHDDNALLLSPLNVRSNRGLEQNPKNHCFGVF